MSAISSGEDRERLARIWRGAAYGATAKDMLWLTQQTIRVVAERDKLLQTIRSLQNGAKAAETVPPPIVPPIDSPPPRPVRHIPALKDIPLFAKPKKTPTKAGKPRRAKPRAAD